jgi:hypothetical protein
MRHFLRVLRAEQQPIAVEASEISVYMLGNVAYSRPWLHRALTCRPDIQTSEWPQLAARDQA